MIIIIINPLQNSATGISCATSGNPPTIPTRMRTTVELVSSPALCSSAANLEAPVQNSPPSPTVATDPVSLTPSNAARAYHVRRRTPADLTATGGVILANVSTEPAPPLNSEKMQEQHVHNSPWTRRRMNAVKNVRTSPPKLEKTLVRVVFKTT